MKIHTTRDRKKMHLCEMTDAHLNATIRMLKRRAEEGVRVRMGGGSCAEDMWYDEEVLYGDEALEALGYADYTKEFCQRILFPLGQM